MLFQKSISTHLLKIVLSIYFTITFAVTVVQISVEYNAAKRDVKKELDIIQRTFETSLSTALWNLDRKQIVATVNGISELPAVVAVEIYDESTLIARSGIELYEIRGLEKLFWHEFSLRYESSHRSENIGIVKVYSSSKVVWNRIELGVLLLVAVAVLKTIILCLLIMIVFDRLLTKPLGLLAKEANDIDPDNIKESRVTIQGKHENELTILGNALNNMMDKVAGTIGELDELNRDLEKKVKLRTEKLNEAVTELDAKKSDLEQEVIIRIQKESALEKSRESLQTSLTQLKETQSQLVEAEKMASLGGLVAGVAHEINTPVGLSLTGATHLQHLLSTLEKAFTAGELEEEEFKIFLSDGSELAHSMVISLKRAADLIKSFKQIAVDQTHETVRTFLMANYINEVLISLRNKLKQTAVVVKVECDEELLVTGYPGIWSQIITNFVSNSLIHGFGKGQKGNIQLVFSDLGDQLQLDYRDDGKGMEQNIAEKIYDPFYTTNREDGGSGLGMHIVYNLVKQKLRGSIVTESSPGKGVHFKISVPKTIDLPEVEGV